MNHNSAFLADLENPNVRKSSGNAEIANHHQQSHLQRQLPELILKPPHLASFPTAARKPNLHHTRSISKDTVVIRRSVRRRKKTSFLDPPNENVDDLRRRGETEYYEHVGTDGRVRRRSMMRTVSREDYLLGRGANPRTGVITPGGWSFDESLDESEALGMNQSRPNAKWRQKGDQWVSISVSDDSSITSQTSLVDMKLRNHTVPVADGPIKPRQRDVSSASPKISSEYFDEQHPSSTSPIWSTTKPAIRRKPVGGSSVQGEQQGRRQERTKALQNSGIIPTVAEDIEFPASPCRQRRYETPDDIGSVPHPASKNCSETLDVPGIANLGSTSPAFLDPDLEPDHGSPQPAKAPSEKVALNKELPDLPMRFGQFPQTPLHGNLVQPITDPLTKLNSQTALEGSSKKSTKYVYQPTLEREMQEEKGITAIPIYDNPPWNHSMMPAPLKMKGPKLKPLIPQIQVEESKVGLPKKESFTTISTSTDTSMTPTRLTRSAPVVIGYPNSNQTQYQQNKDIVLTKQFQKVNTDVGMTTEKMMTSSTPRMELKASSHPAKMQRLVGSLPVGGTRPLHRIRSKTHTASLRPLNMTGMQQADRAGRNIPRDSEGLDTVAGLVNLRGGAIQQYPRQRLTSGASRSDVTLEKENKSETQPLGRKCSRCCGGFILTGEPSTMDQKVSSVPTLPRHVIDPIGMPSSLFSTQEQDVRGNNPQRNPTDQVETHIRRTAVAPANVLQPGLSSSLDSNFDHAVLRQVVETAATQKSNDKKAKDDRHLCSRCHVKSCHGICAITSSPSEDSPTVGSQLLSIKSQLVDTNSPNLHEAQLAPIEYSKSRKLAPRILTTTDHARSKQDAKEVKSQKSEGELTDQIVYQLTRPSFGAVSAAKSAIGFRHEASNVDGAVCHRLTVAKNRQNKPSNTGSACGESLLASCSSQTSQEMRSQNFTPENNWSNGCQSKLDKMSIDSTTRKTTPLTGWTTKFTPRSPVCSGHSSTVQTGAKSARISYRTRPNLCSMWDILSAASTTIHRCFQKNPKAVSFLAKTLALCWQNCCEAVNVSRQLFNLLYMYGKTGEIRLPTNVTVLDLGRDCLKSVLCGVILIMIINMLIQVLHIVLLPLQMAAFIVRTLVMWFARATTALI